jgi:hypothetical protein
MSPFVAHIDRFVRWFFNVSPLTMSIEPQQEPEPPRRRAASSSPSRRARSASPKDRRDRSADRREPRGTGKSPAAAGDREDA